MVYGWGYGAERERVNLAGGKDMGWKLQALENAWLPMSKWIRVCETQYAALEAAMENGRLPPPAAVSNLGVCMTA